MLAFPLCVGLRMQTREVDVQQIAAWLTAVPLCVGLSADEMSAIAAQVRVRDFVEGETLAAANVEVIEFWVIVAGQIEAVLEDARGHEKLLGVVHPGETVGDVALLEKTRRPVRFTARSSGTLLAISAATFHEWLEAYSPLMRNLFRTLSQRYKRVVGIESRKLPSPRLGIVSSSARGMVLVRRLTTRLLAAGERLNVWAEHPESLQQAGAWPESQPVRSLAPADEPLVQLSPESIDRQIVVWSPSSGEHLDIRRLIDCDEVLWLTEPSEGQAVFGYLRRAASELGELSEKARVVWLLDANTRVAPWLAGWDLKKPDLKAPVESTGNRLTRLESQGLDRLVRALRGFSVGIALAGGGAKGMAHFGVLHALEEAGISFDAMSGTSAGAMAGILYAAGMSPESAVEGFQSDLNPSRLFRMIPKWPNWYLLTQFRRRAWESMLRSYLHDWRLEQLAIPFHSVTVDLVQARAVIRRQGDAVHALLESINLPVVSRPILRDGMVLVDGGILNNLPADVLADGGVDFVVGVDVSSRIRHEFAGNRPGMPDEQMKAAGALDTLFRIFEAQAHSLGNLRNRAVDFWITPDTSPFALADFHRTREIAAAGETATHSKLSELKQRLAELELRLLEQPPLR